MAYFTFCFANPHVCGAPMFMKFRFDLLLPIPIYFRAAKKALERQSNFDIIMAKCKQIAGIYLDGIQSTEKDRLLVEISLLYFVTAIEYFLYFKVLI